MEQQFTVEKLGAANIRAYIYGNLDSACMYQSDKLYETPSVEDGFLDRIRDLFNYALAIAYQEILESSWFKVQNDKYSIYFQEGCVNRVIPLYK